MSIMLIKKRRQRHSLSLSKCTQLSLHSIRIVSVQFRQPEQLLKRSYCEVGSKGTEEKSTHTSALLYKIKNKEDYVTLQSGPTRSEEQQHPTCLISRTTTDIVVSQTTTSIHISLPSHTHAHCSRPTHHSRPTHRSQPAHHSHQSSHRFRSQWTLVDRNCQSIKESEKTRIHGIHRSSPFRHPCHYVYTSINW